jgi:probable HAF family extracellular repeat protein
MNESGEVVGDQSIPGEGHTEAVLYSAGKLTYLGLLPGEGGIETAATGINKSGEITGSGDNAGSAVRAWLYKSGKMTDIGTLGGRNAESDASIFSC